MKERLRSFAEAYAAAEEKTAGQGDGRSSIHYPAVFLFIGDRLQEAADHIRNVNARKWDNGAGVMYVEVQPERSAFPSTHREEHPQQLISRLSVPDPERSTAQTRRPDWARHFREEGSHLLELNRVFRQAARRLADFGRMYSSFDRLHLSVVTRVEDPMNVLVPEIALLARSILGQSFKSVQMDLYVLVHEGEQEENFGYASSAGIAFLHEVELMQRDDYHLSAPLQRTEDGLAVMVHHTAAPLFELVYTLSDRNERGVSVNGGIASNYDIICRISLLKNRQRSDNGHDSSLYGSDYNNMAFRNNIRIADGTQGLVSAGFARVRRPDEAIALTVLEHFFLGIVQRMKQDSAIGTQEREQLLGVDEASMERRLDAFIPDESRLEDMNGLMTRSVSFSSLRSMSLHEAEQALFEQSGDDFFGQNYEREAQRRLDEWNVEHEFRTGMDERLKGRSDVHFYQLAAWTEENHPASLWPLLHGRIRDLNIAIEQARQDLDAWYGSRADDLSFQKLPFMDKHNVRSLTRALLATIYPHKLYILRLQTKLKLYRRWEDQLLALHRGCRVLVQQMDELGTELHSASATSLRLADDYIGQNVSDYYSRLTAEAMLEVEDRRGEAAFFEERSMGDVTALLKQGTSALLERLIEVCRRELLPAPALSQTFEQELLSRANVTIDYHNKQALSQEDLFKELYRTLEDRATIHIRLLDYTHKHRYEEKYMFGNANGEFVRYAAGVDHTTRIYKTGFVHEDRTSGVEKLNLMGGFGITDLMYYRNGRTYYDTYVANGYRFHVEDEQQQ
ncbi:transcription initiation factor TFIID [Paenibacillus wenxiniae]|uniref:Transcription initiation factor TFIID n=1 Tax=Paenibacillus wenxiniae TaxID=1636843 RepID=A0ABW4RLQ9_9BACL